MTHLDKIKTAAHEVHYAELQLKTRVRDALNDGVPIRQAALAAGITRQTVYNWKDAPLINLDNLDWTEAPAGYDSTDTLFNIQLANFLGEEDPFGTGVEGDLILAHDIDKGASALAGFIGGQWRDSQSTEDWPAFDRLFGRTYWQEFVSNHQEETLQELADSEDVES